MVVEEEERQTKLHKDNGTFESSRWVKKILGGPPVPLGYRLECT